MSAVEVNHDVFLSPINTFPGVGLVSVFHLVDNNNVIEKVQEFRYETYSVSQSVSQSVSHSQSQATLQSPGCCQDGRDLAETHGAVQGAERQA